MEPPYTWSLRVYLLWIAYATAVPIFDTLDDAICFFCAPCRPVSDYKPSDLDHVSTEEINALIGLAPPLSNDPADGSHIKRVTPMTVIKDVEDINDMTSHSSEALALELVFRETTIPMSRLRRVIDSRFFRYIIIDHIPGRQLSVVWPSLGFIERLRAAITLRRYIRQLRAIKPPNTPAPGPLGPDRPRKCPSPLFGPRIPSRGPFTSYAELSSFFNARDSMVPQQVPRPIHFDDSQPLVFTHQDLNMRNILMGDDGRIWLIDWGWAGYYPCWFEYVAMKKQSVTREMSVERKEPFWDALIPFICDPYFGQEIWHKRMAGAFEFT